MVSASDLEDSGSNPFNWFDSVQTSTNAIAILASVAVVVASSTLVLFLCAICRRYSMDFTDYDKDNTQVIYNVSAGAKELPSEYTLGEYRGYNTDYSGPITKDVVMANPAAMGGVENNGYTPSPYNESNNNVNTISDDDNSLTLQNDGFQPNSP